MSGTLTATTTRADQVRIDYHLDTPAEGRELQLFQSIDGNAWSDCAISWDPDQPGSPYNNPNNGYYFDDWSTGGTLWVDQLDAATTYQFRMRNIGGDQFDAGGTTLYSAPYGLQDNGDGSVCWYCDVVGVAFDVFYSSDDGETWQFLTTTLTDQTTLDLSGLPGEPGELYGLRVQVEQGQSDLSDWIEVAAPLPPEPVAAGGLMRWEMWER